MLDVRSWGIRHSTRRLNWNAHIPPSLPNLATIPSMAIILGAVEANWFERGRGSNTLDTMLQRPSW